MSFSWPHYVRNTLRTKFARSAFTLFNCCCIAHCVSEYLCSVLICSGPSMEPTLYSKDVIITENISSRLHRYNYGDIVVFRSSRNQKELVCKRIIGLPGDRILFRDNCSIPAGHVWLEGDNRNNSWDSRDYGPVPQGLIVGRVICIVFPFRNMTMLTVRSR